MSRLTERTALAHLRRSWKLLPVMIQPIETSTGTGVPDVYMWFNTTEGIGWWLEFKVGTRKPTPAQREWIYRARCVRLLAAVLRCWPGHTFSLDDGDIRYNQMGLYKRLSQPH